MSFEHDEQLLRVPCDVEERDELRLDWIRAEVDRGFDALRDIDDGVSIFGSARIAEDHRWYEPCRETAACLARHGFTVITGGGPGLMEAADLDPDAPGPALPDDPRRPRPPGAPLLRWIDDDLEDNGLIDRADLRLLVTADTSEEICNHVRQASEAQKQLA